MWWIQNVVSKLQNLTGPHLNIDMYMQQSNNLIESERRVRDFKLSHYISTNIKIHIFSKASIHVLI